MKIKTIEYPDWLTNINLLLFLDNVEIGHHIRNGYAGEKNRQRDGVFLGIRKRPYRSRMAFGMSVTNYNYDVTFRSFSSSKTWHIVLDNKSLFYNLSDNPELLR